METLAATSESIVMRDQRVAVFGHVDSPQVLAELVCEVAGMPPLDALHIVRNTPGVLAQPFSLTEARQLVERIQPLGIQATVVADADLPNVRTPSTIHHARFTDEALEVCDLQGRCATRVPWNELAVIATGSVPSENHLRFIDDGRPTVLSTAPLPNTGRLATPERPHLELWLLCRNPSAVYRLKHDEFNYETLGDQRAASAAENFDHLVCRLVELAPHARRTPGTHAYLQHRLAGYEFKSCDTIQQQALLGWILNRGLTETSS